ncbi:pyridoxal phosphate-dependent aminotransferase [Chondromyces apiculatus]|uniref:Aromatic-amino-acid aminotransferase n=1 Tax=Chondromyces apiculatus DSM 436 TaxID=1192034 RepID=A0A017T473_9BACT|nr:aminotransferase class I/II-fold pyridoxal phosphate-dependent enzyme [Chondromyces apiculatus]EYF04028.1 Aromatic-amino-acid aminotransferase [Chondromyces apiculatus DSM 436]
MEFLIPTRTSRPSDDPIFALNTEARARAAAGEAIINATVGALLDDEGRLSVLGSVAQTLREVPPNVGAGYAPIEGDASFLKAVVADVMGQRPEADWTVAIATPGGSGALRLAMADFLDTGQAALTTSYFWGPYRTIADELDRGLATFRMFDANGRLDGADLEHTLSAQIEAQGRALLFINSPCHNPTGYSFDADEWRQLAAIVGRAADRAPVTLLIDIAYARYGQRSLDEAVDALLGLAGRALLLFAWSASKSFTQYGLRVGALLAVHPDPEARRRIRSALSYSCRGTWSNCNAGGMAAIGRALTDPDLRARTDQERAALKSLLDRRVEAWNSLATDAGLRYPRYDGGFFTTVFCADAFAVAARLKEEGIFVVPQTGALRVALCSVAERDIPRLVQGIARHVTR